MRKFRQHEKLPKKIADAGDSPLRDADLPAKSKHQPDDDKGDANRKDKG